jgi:hypothetical protein
MVRGWPAATYRSAASSMVRVSSCSLPFANGRGWSNIVAWYHRVDLRLGGLSPAASSNVVGVRGSLAARGVHLSRLRLNNRQDGSPRWRHAIQDGPLCMQPGSRAQRCSPPTKSRKRKVVRPQELLVDRLKTTALSTLEIRKTRKRQGGSRIPRGLTVEFLGSQSDTIFTEKTESHRLLQCARLSRASMSGLEQGGRPEILRGKRTPQGL